MVQATRGRGDFARLEQLLEAAQVAAGLNFGFRLKQLRHDLSHCACGGIVENRGRHFGPAQALGIPRAYGSYEDMLADPEIEAIYNPLPNHLHVPLTLQAAAAGKHVLCEKPIALSAEEAATLRAAAGRVRIEEAFMVRHHPQWQRARELLRAGRIGTPRAVQVAFSYFNDDPANIRNQAAIGGGALYDIGCYAILSGRWLFEAEPRRVLVARFQRQPKQSPTASSLAGASGKPRRDLLHLLHHAQEVQTGQFTHVLGRPPAAQQLGEQIGKL